MFDDCPITDFQPSPGCLGLKGLPILIDENDYDGIHIAVDNLACDLKSVTGQKPEIWTTTTGKPDVAGLIVIGSLPRCRFMAEITAKKGGHAEGIRGKWETFETTIRDSPWPVAKQMLVITGSDKRGTIFGAYTLSEHIGVSPWYWWADVPVQPREQVYALPVTVRQGEPSVQYRGIFINDEAPALRDWARDKFGPHFNAEFYKKVFELLLRLKANFLWPAMWAGYPEPGSSFFTDDPMNQKMADQYGIVISTSHHEPMQRSMTEWHMSHKGPWNWEKNKAALREHFAGGAARAQPFESVITLGMRGDSDKELDAEDPLGTLRDVISTQREIIRDSYGGEDRVPQVMALYKEVQAYYEDGLAIPEDVILLFADDNFGHIRRLPSKKERQRRGGFGGKVQQQLRQAFDNGVSKLWVFNVGDLKPLELPITFAMAMAWNINCVTPATVPRFFDAYAKREFGPEHVDDISGLLLEHDRLMALRRHEHIEPDTFSVLSYDEADTILRRFQQQERKSSAVFDAVNEPYKAAYFQLVHYPIRASRIFVDLQVSLGKNRLYGEQRRNTTNAFAERVQALFDLDWELTQEYHHSSWTGDKWNHIMKQPHYGFAASHNYHTPSRNLIRGLSFVQRRQDSTPIAGQMGVAVEGHAGVLPGLVNEECCRMQPSRGERAVGLLLPCLSPYGNASCYFEVFNRGARPVEWTIESPFRWLGFSLTGGKLEADGKEDRRVDVTVNWDALPEDFRAVVDIGIRSTDNDYEQIHLPIDNRQVPVNFSGSVESAGCISILAGATTFTQDQQNVYQVLPYVGRLPSGGVSLSSSPPDSTRVPYLEYPVFVFTASKRSAQISLYFTMALDAQPDSRLVYDFAVNDDMRQGMYLIGEDPAADLPADWNTAVQDLVWIKHHRFDIASPGPHKLRYRPLAEGIILEKIVVDLGGCRMSYLGPPPSSVVQAGTVASAQQPSLRYGHERRGRAIMNSRI
ncbi:hypothetical protein SPI_00764 [Niveomyces insectorum RCEF 264]|uniref:Gylcosyl hydrolase 115 C-terminal domain-containing protein n=1 Tax=Niveomyces insectorum RCEF 264 TaxID=1081102 RepID=A0A162MQL1_9HYPO|nr:hypothetical protein SPI_00764 [Niveomyces insectorum RCEF 264]